MYSNRLQQLLAARWWGSFKNPTEWDRLDKDDKIEILAAYQADWKRTAIDNYEAEQEAKRRARRPSAGGRRRPRV